MGGRNSGETGCSTSGKRYATVTGKCGAGAEEEGGEDSAGVCAQAH